MTKGKRNYSIRTQCSSSMTTGAPEWKRVSRSEPARQRRQMWIFNDCPVMSVQVTRLMILFTATVYPSVKVTVTRQFAYLWRCGIMIEGGMNQRSALRCFICRHLSGRHLFFWSRQERPLTDCSAIVDDEVIAPLWICRLKCGLNWHDNVLEMP